MRSNPRRAPCALTGLPGADHTSGQMRRGRLSTLLRGAVLMPLLSAVVLAAVLPDSIRTLVCRFSGVVMPEETCCPQQDAADLSAQDQLQDESCCVVKTVHLARPVSDVQSPTSAPAPHVACTSVAPAEAPHVVARGAIVRRPTILPVGPPILLVKQAFLI
jgi:hypothetical protein